MKSVCILPIRSGSKGIPDKNIKPIAGKPLFEWALDAANDSAVDDILISTDYGFCDLGYSGEVAMTGVAVKVPLLRGSRRMLTYVTRPPELCTDTATTESALLHALDYTDAEIIVCLSACSPLVESAMINSAIHHLATSDHVDSIVSVVPFKGFGLFERKDGGPTWPLHWDPRQRPMRQDATGQFLEVGMLWAIRRASLMTRKCRIGYFPSLMPVYQWAIHEIDEPADWEFMAHLLELRKAGKI